MTYYKVKPEFDQKRRADGSIFVGGELYTKSELKRYKAENLNIFEVVNIPKNKVYWFFGARLA